MKKDPIQNEWNRRDFLRDSSLAAIMTLMGGLELKAAEKTDDPGDKPAGPPVKCAVVGCGPWGREILKSLSTLSNAPVIAVCDTYPAFQRRALESAPQAKSFDDYRRVLEQKDVQAVLVATPSHLHRQIAVDVLQAGKHLYCEAPLATTLEDARAIAKAALAAPKQMFQAGMIFRSNPIHKHVLQFVRTGAMGKNNMLAAQWHKKESWRRKAPTPERERAINWRLDASTSIGLMGELGIHSLDIASWYLMARPVSVTGFGEVLAWNDGRNVPDTVQAIIEFPGNIRMIYDATLGNSFGGACETFYGTESAIVIRQNRAWMLKETDAPLLGWEVYARKEAFTPTKETGIALVANATQLLAQGKEPAETAANSEPPLHYALEEFIANINESKAPSCSPNDAFNASVLAIKANEAIFKGATITYENQWFA
ncbi:MAG: Gfo/Idh/MocA family oxidoreductase [Candidatus Omnitrophica bacterium]|nr:Gfo/Idh/MocA family oxidoreductase [Candidatus Omnitrophota bacterium]